MYVLVCEHWCMPTWGKPQVQFANIRKMVLYQGLPFFFFTSAHLPMLEVSSLHAWPQNLEAFLDHPKKTMKKNTKCDQFSCLTSDFFDFCNPCFFYHTFTNNVDFVDKADAEICDHSLFIAVWLYNRSVLAGCTGDQCSHNKLHWSPVSRFNACPSPMWPLIHAQQYMNWTGGLIPIN